MGSRKRGAPISSAIVQEAEDVNADVTDVLTGVRGVEAIKELSTTNNLFRYAIDLSYDCAPEIAAAVQATGLNLHLLQPEQRNLESVFAAVNEPQTEQAP